MPRRKVPVTFAVLVAAWDELIVIRLPWSWGDGGVACSRFESIAYHIACTLIVEKSMFQAGVCDIWPTWT